MNITSKLGYRYILKNKKRSMSIILGIVIVTVLVTLVVTLLSSYQQYLVRSVRAKKNWELELNNINYEDVSKIENNDNIKEISIIRKLGVSEEDFRNYEGRNITTKIKLNVREYTKNALKNGNFKITEGRFPENSNEIIISDFSKNIHSKNNATKTQVGKNILVTINGQTKEYLVVGKIACTNFDKASFNSDYEAGAITYLDTSKLDNNAIVNVSVLTKNIQKVYETGNDFINELNIISKEEQHDEISEEEQLEQILNGTQKNKHNSIPSIEYNEELLNYECVIDNGNSEFARNLLIIGILAIIIFGIFSMIMIKSSFNMTYLDRIKELGVLASIGMDKKQRTNMIKVETRILGFFGIGIGIILGLIFSHISIEMLNNWIKLVKTSSIFVLDENVELYMKVPFLAILLIVIIVWIFIKISSILPMKKINKISPIEAIKNIVNIKITEKQVKSPKIIEKLFKEEGVLAYKNIRKNKIKYRTVVYSLAISLILFLSINGIISNIDKKYNSGKTNMYDDYFIEIETDNFDKNQVIDIKKVENMMEYLKENELVYDCYANIQGFNDTKIELNENQVSDSFKNIINNKVVNLSKSRNGNIEMPLRYCWIFGNAYDEILKKAGVTELKENEVIITNNITENTKYGNNINITNFKVGDKYTLNIAEWRGEVVEREFTIAGIVDDFEPYISGKLSNNIAINQLVSPDNAINLIKEFNYISFAKINIKTDQNKAAKIDNCISEIKDIYGEDAIIMGNNNLPTDFSKYKTDIDPSEDVIRISTEKISIENEKNILKTLLYSFVGIVATIISVNTYNTIYYSILIRKREFASLKSIGMSEKQIKKMTLLESIFYWFDSMIFGVGISIVVLYFIYLIIIGNKVYLFNIPYISIVISIFVMYIIIFFSIMQARKKLKNINIVDEIREENI